MQGSASAPGSASRRSSQAVWFSPTAARAAAGSAPPPRGKTYLLLECTAGVTREGPRRGPLRVSAVLALDVPRAALGPEHEVTLRVRHVVERDGGERLPELGAVLGADGVLDALPDHRPVAGSQRSRLPLYRQLELAFGDDHHLLRVLVRVRSD